MDNKILLWGIGFLCLLFQSLAMAALKESPLPISEMSKETRECVKCHEKNNPGIVQEWGKSKHYGANVGCYECHAAEQGDVDAYVHDDKKVKKLIFILVTPKDCGTCHEKAAHEMTSSRHAKAGHILDSLDNLLAEVVEGNREMVTGGFPGGNSAAAVNGCWQCHGSKVRVLEDGQLDPATYPNTGIGLINPDGSEGSCSACHSRHGFSAALAREPDNCGKCHLGPDHPQKEIYEESKHGIAFKAYRDEMNLDSSKWVVGVDYTAAPTCATCHMGATRKQPSSHNVGDRISWTNRPPISVRPEVMDAKMGLASADLKWDTRRENMKDVCNACHSEDHTDKFYTQYDALIELYNEKFAKPGKALMEAAKPLLKQAKFSNKVDWTWFELWHHEGRRARMAASMQAPDYTHSHGTYDLAKHFYTKMVPELEELVAEGMASGDPEKIKAAEALQAKLDEVLASDNHKWYLGQRDMPAMAKK
jgi:hydroxylamine dehydrogenase